ncbi:AAA family ATPase [Cytobacillus sp. FJAT-54145]|uniref:AAA family ATPase n=1 Tax=Cytobacillus spartinae TaxID=3299023 RepID=A0ABW6K8J1_9BACI
MDFINHQFLKRIEIKRDEVPTFNQYPFNIPSIKLLKDITFHPNVTYLIGENGMGKSTLLEAIAISSGFNPEGGSLNFSFSTYDSHSSLEQYLRVMRGTNRPKDGFFLRAETFYNLASNIEELDSDPLGGGRVIDSFGGVSLHEQSHGEAFFATFMNRFGENGLYILDEPEAALSPLRQLSMLSRIHELVKEGSQFIIATHSPIIMAYPSSTIFEFSEEGVEERTLEETNHYKIMKQFFEDKERLLHHLLNQ